MSQVWGRACWRRGRVGQCGQYCLRLLGGGLSCACCHCLSRAMGGLQVDSPAWISLLGILQAQRERPNVLTKPANERAWLEPCRPGALLTAVLMPVGASGAESVHSVRSTHAMRGVLASGRWCLRGFCGWPGSRGGGRREGHCQPPRLFPGPGRFSRGHFGRERHGTWSLYSGGDLSPRAMRAQRGATAPQVGRKHRLAVATVPRDTHTGAGHAARLSVQAEDNV